MMPKLQVGSCFIFLFLHDRIANPRNKNEVTPPPAISGTQTLEDEEIFGDEALWWNKGAGILLTNFAKQISLDQSNRRSAS